MTDPLITPGDLGVVLNNQNINYDRAEAMIADAQALCETIVSPLPPVAAVVVKRVAARGYVAAGASRSDQLAASGSPFSTSPAGPGEVWLTRADKADLRRFSGGGGAFSINMLPDDYIVPFSTYVGDDGDPVSDWDSPT